MSFISWIKKLCLSIIDILRRLFLRPSDFSDVILEYRIACALRSGDLSKTALLQKMYIKNKPDDTWRHNQLVRTYVLQGNSEKGRQHFEQLFKSSPELSVYKSVNFHARQRDAIERGIPSIYINTIPKTASEFIVSKLSEGLDMPRIRLTAKYLHNIPFRSHFDLFKTGGVICKEHTNVNSELFKLLEGSGFRKFVFHIRDPRSIVISGLRGIEKSFQFDGHDALRESHYHWLVSKKRIPEDFREWSQKKRIEHEISKQMPKLVTKINGFLQLRAEKDRGFEIHITHYEKLLTEPVSFFEEILDFYEVPSKLFKPNDLIAKPEIGSHNFRSGLASEWMDIFDEQHRNQAWELIPKNMREFFGWCP